MSHSASLLRVKSLELPEAGKEPLGGIKAERTDQRSARTSAWSFVSSLFSTLKKRGNPRGLTVSDGSWTRGLGCGWGKSPGLGLPCLALRAWVGTGHRLTDSQTQSRADGSRINNFIYTLHTVWPALLPALARGVGVGAAGARHSPSSVCQGLGGVRACVQLERKGESAAKGGRPTCSRRGRRWRGWGVDEGIGRMYTGWKWLPDGVTGREDGAGG